MNEHPLPRGIWFESARDRYRVRKYRNGKPHLIYCKTEVQARAALRELEQALLADPKQRTRGVVPTATFAALVRAAQKSNRK